MGSPTSSAPRLTISQIRRTWRFWVVIGAGAWSALAVVAGALWAADIIASPFGLNDPRAAEVGSYFGGLEPQQTGIITLVLGLTGVITVILVRLTPNRRWLVVPALALGVVLIVVIPDVRVIQNFAYLFFGYTGLWDGALAAELVAMVGGILWLGTAAAQLGRGRSSLLVPHVPRWAVPVTYVSAIFALPYPTVRIAWALGFPLGMPADYVDDWPWTERLGLALVFGGLPVVGAILTIGLTRSWGETFPRWVPWLRGRRVPIWMAVVPGTWAAVPLTQMGLRVTTWIAHDLRELSWDTWGASLPGLFALPWGLTLAAAVYAYAVRRI